MGKRFLKLTKMWYAVNNELAACIHGFTLNYHKIEETK